MTGLARDLRIALRGLRRTPVFALTAIAILAVSSGAVIAAVAVIYSVLLRPLPIRDQDRVVIAWKEDFKAGFTHFPFSHSSTDHILPLLRTVSAVATIDYNGAWPLSTVDGGTGMNLPTGQVSGNFFEVLGVEPVIGRLFRPEDDVIGGPRLIAIGEKVWRSRYGADPDVIGRSMQIFGIAHEIVGVVPADFEYPRGAVAWTPMYPWQGKWLDDPNAVTQDVVARLKPGVTLAQFTAELERIRATSPLEIRPDFANHRVVAKPFVAAVIGDLRPTLLLVGAGAFLVLIVASANMGSLLLVRTGARLHEIAIRAAMGASRGQVGRAAVIEYGLVVVLGVGAGILAGWAALALTRSSLTIDIPRELGLSLTPTAVIAGAALSLVVTTVGGLASGAAIFRADLTSALRSNARSGSGYWGAHPLRRQLVAVQLALAVTAVTGAALLVRTLDRLERIDLGLEPKNLYLGTITISVPLDSAFQANSVPFVDRLIEAVERVEGVVSAATTFSPPFVAEAGAYSRMKAEGQPESDLAEMPLANREAVTPGYFETMGMTLRRGRFLEATDREGSLPVVVINEALARLHWPGRDPIGQRLGYADAPNPQWRTVVGVVANARYNELKVPSPAIYVPYRQINETPWNLVIRTRDGVGHGALVTGLRREFVSAGYGLALVSAEPMVQLLAKPLGPATAAAGLTLGFAAVALLLAGLGIYSVLSSLVMQRTREFGVRMALGADTWLIATLVVRQASRLVATGLLVGMIASWLVGRGLKRLLFEVSPTDPATLSAVAVILALVSLAASLEPVVRAARVDPVVSLRAE